MKFTVSSVLKAATSAAAIILAISTSQVTALPVNTVANIEKRAITGLNDYSCKLTAAHPRPLVLVHATLLTVDSWSNFAPEFIKEGYCVFGLTYGYYKNETEFGGLAPIEDSAQELGTFVNNVLAKMNSKQVDIVGHSQGGILARYWIKYLDGAGKVYRHVGVSPITHGTTLDDITTFAKALNLFNGSESTFDYFAPSFYQMVVNSTFMEKLNAGGVTAPGVIHSNIATKYDEVVTPYENCYMEVPGVTNTLLQDLCMASLNEHLTMVDSDVVLQWVLNQLDPSTAQTANCLSGLF
ncbi:hypothetical protein BGZ46_003498 [Entomortierella lignicola]|nr:hypothetical protein BGZ46_003498 [Entomortierella lignicola]